MSYKAKNSKKNIEKIAQFWYNFIGSCEKEKIKKLLTSYVGCDIVYKA